MDNQKPGDQDDPPEFLRRYSDEFETFWRAYPVPLNSSKIDAWKAWQSVERPPLAMLLECAARYAEAVDAENRRRKPNDQRQTCHPATWLRGQRWEGFLPKTEPAVTRETTPPWDGHPAGAQLLDEIGPDHFDTWLRPCKLAINDGVPVLTAPSRLIRNRVAADYIDRLERVFGGPVVLQ